jgi:hypothetical protein
MQSLVGRLSRLKTGTPIPNEANYHAMAMPGQSTADAIQGFNDAVAFEQGVAADRFGWLDPDWYINHTIAIHALMDSTSPEHVSSDGAPIVWPSFPNMFEHGDLPTSGETWDNMTPALMQRKIDLIRNSWSQVTGQTWKCRCNNK